ncbi:unnamed protein product, partial [Arabidopsis halleri]
MGNNIEYNEVLEACFREMKNEFENLKLSVAEIFRSFEESVNRLVGTATRNISGRGRVSVGNAQGSARSNAKSHHTKQNVRAGTNHMKHHHHTSRTRKPHRPERKKKTTRTGKKKKRQGKKFVAEVLVHWQELSPMEATWKDAPAFLRTLRTR